MDRFRIIDWVGKDRFVRGENRPRDDRLRSIDWEKWEFDLRKIVVEQTFGDNIKDK